MVVSPLKSIAEDQIKEAKSLGLLYLFGFLTFVAQGLQTLSDSVELRVIQIPTRLQILAKTIPSQPLLLEGLKRL